MRLTSTNGRAPETAFRAAIREGLAPDGGLYLPVDYPHLGPGDLAAWRGLPFTGVARQLIGDPALEIELLSANVWTVTHVPGRMFAYQLQRPGRLFRVEFDLTKPVALPPAPWGDEGAVNR